jgi:hypothetical protein
VTVTQRTASGGGGSDARDAERDEGEEGEQRSFHRRPAHHHPPHPEPPPPEQWNEGLVVDPCVSVTRDQPPPPRASSRSGLSGGGGGLQYSNWESCRESWFSSGSDCPRPGSGSDGNPPLGGSHQSFPPPPPARRETEAHQAGVLDAFPPPAAYTLPRAGAVKAVVGAALRQSSRESGSSSSRQSSRPGTRPSTRSSFHPVFTYSIFIEPKLMIIGSNRRGTNFFIWLYFKPVHILYSKSSSNHEKKTTAGAF